MAIDPRLPTFIVMFIGHSSGYEYRFSYAENAQDARTELDSGHLVGIRAIPFPVPEDPLEEKALLVMVQRLNFGSWINGQLIPLITEMALEVERFDRQNQ